ncbi:DsbA family protein [Nonomuraea endophytica]|uniref:DsbA family protein n=1 Tax=Nonomuraea endophytica TaxID=714136 RepID=UPI0037C6A626
MTDITVDIWSDLVCPWCYIGHRRFAHALAAFEHRDAVQVRHRSFELDPRGSTEPTITLPERMRRDLGLPAPQARAGMARVAALAAEVGLEYRLDLAHPVNSFDAHRVQHAAADRGVGEAVRERLMRAYTGTRGRGRGAAPRGERGARLRVRRPPRGLRGAAVRGVHRGAPHRLAAGRASITKQKPRSLA